MRDLEVISAFAANFENFLHSWIKTGRPSHSSSTQTDFIVHHSADARVKNGDNISLFGMLRVFFAAEYCRYKLNVWTLRYLNLCGEDHLGKNCPRNSGWVHRSCNAFYANAVFKSILVRSEHFTQST